MLSTLKYAHVESIHFNKNNLERASEADKSRIENHLQQIRNDNQLSVASIDFSDCALEDDTLLPMANVFKFVKKKIDFACSNLSCKSLVRIIQVRYF